MDVFVTGGTGDIGSAIVRNLVKDGASVIGLSRSERASDKLRALGASAYPGDLCQPDSWVERAASCDAVIHAGATFSDDMGRVDRQSMLALKNAARHRKQPLKIVYTGGIWLYPASDQGAPITEKTAFSPLPAFRYMTETIRTLTHGTDLNLIVIHPALVCSRTSGPIADMTQALKTGVPFQTRANLNTFWPLVESNDLADLYVRALKHPRFRISMIGSGISGVTVGDLASHISARHGLPLEVQTQAIPHDADPDTDWAAGYALSQTVDPGHARRSTGWSPDHSTVEDLVVSLSR
ncbi:MAG: NAD-dependent epimerase/dehydratase family protein [Roseibium sp.]|uniref:NAD-dependent epimerase/dehydratase family protein n=1 Tax=Roseibium sp. TaxID=1936156 RepID=UPI001B05A4E7|nr:NAD-dependent epimerase/dehydratase family protein [Roseibium sp.]MBO6894321.1 NAD-dependent epimerase/dehydratase family protein [Roseibium sp.]MBO6931895.1 NAD-dependent epimerase/dehydratase family protein [Roseibium sp.]